MKAYEQFLRDAGTPIGTFGAIILAGWIVVRVFTFMFSSTPEEKMVAALQDDWTARCEQISIGTSIATTTKKIGGQHFCAASVLIEDYPLYDFAAWERGCKALGGVRKFQGNESYSCYREEIVEDLGSQENWEGTQ